MTSDMSLFKIKTKKNNKKSNLLLALFISLLFMFSVWTYANLILEKMAPLHMQFVALSLFVFVTAIMTIIEGIYKTSSLLFNCKDDDLLLSLPIKRRTVLFIRVFKFYIFELLFNSLFIIPLVVAYIRWADTISWTFFVTSIIMVFILPIIPIVLSCFIGVITSSISSRFKNKNAVQTIISILFILFIMYLSYNADSFVEYLIKNATSVNDLITKIYYPAGMYAKLAINFNIKDLLIFILSSIIIFAITIYIISTFYFKINSRIKNVTTTKKVKFNKLVIKANNPTKSLIRKELNNFFSTPVFIINSGFSLVLFIIMTFMAAFKFNSIIKVLTDPSTINMSKNMILSNLSLLVFGLILFTSFMTSITNSMISLEGKNINIIKSLPTSAKKVLISKIYAALVLTTPVLLLGDIVLICTFKIGIIDSLLLLILSVITPLISHFIGLIINLKFPKLDYESPTDVVKQSTSSFLSVMLGMMLMVVTIVAIVKLIGKISATMILLLALLLFILLDIILYIYLVKKGTKDFNNLSI
jgi:ABC-2 type transport system permease protein